MDRRSAPALEERRGVPLMVRWGSSSSTLVELFQAGRRPFRVKLNASGFCDSGEDSGVML